MPTESTFLFAGLLFLAAAMGYVFARFGDEDEEDLAERSTRTNLLRSFRYLLNDDADRAVDVFTDADAVTDEVLDTQLALGSLFRRRGELDRAIRLHQNLLDRSTSTSAQRQAAAFALAEDFLSAGLFDRAEELLLRLRDTPDYRLDALRRLIRIAEVTSEWDRAVDLCGELNGVEPGSVAPAQLAHYYCELAGQARQKGQLPEARQFLEQARAINRGMPRIALLEADLHRDAGDIQSAVATLVKLGRDQPGMVGELLPRLLAYDRGSDSQPLVLDALAGLAGSPEAQRRMALELIRNPKIDDPVVVRFLAGFLIEQPEIRPLVVRPGNPVADPLAEAERLRPLLQKLISPGQRFLCGNCGYRSATLHWQCPGCRSWDTTTAVDDLALSR